jgi:hypothetical protein
MGQVLNPVIRLLQNTADEHVFTNFGEDVFNHYQSLVKGSERISTGISKSRPGAIAQVASEVAKPEATVAEAVTQAGGMARRTLSGVLEAGEVAAKVMRFRI